MKQINPGAAKRRVHHHVHRPVRSERPAKRLQTRGGIGKMVQHAGAYDVIEFLAKLLSSLDLKAAQLEILKRMLLLELLLERDAPFADVNSDDASVRPAHRIVRRLHRAATGN